MNREFPASDIPQPIDLARQVDFTLGTLRVFPSRCEIEAGANREYVQPRVMQVLTALVLAEGTVVSRDALIETCWGGRIVGDDAINRCIVKIRKIAELDETASVTVETIPRVGYRLTLRTILEPVIAPAPAKPVPPVQVVRSRWWIGAVSAAAAAAGLFIWLMWPQPKWTVTAGRAFISTLAKEEQPAFSPDGAMIAYAAGTENSHKILVRGVTAGDTATVVADSYDDISPTWASDGVRIAYVAARDHEPCRIMVVTLPAGHPHEAGRCIKRERTSLSWQRGSNFVYFADKGPHGDAIFRLDIQTGERQQIVNTAWEMLPEPRVSPDGKWLAFIAFSNFTRNAIRLRNLRTGEEKMLGLLVGGDFAAWTEDSKTVLVTISYGVSTEIRAYPINSQAPYRVYVTAANLGRLAAGPGGLLAVEADVGRINLARASASARAAPDVIDAANGQTWSPNFARDGTLAFISNRSGENAIWTMRPGEEPVELLSAGLMPVERVRWAPDGTKLVFLSEANSGVTVNVVTAQGARVASFAMPSIGFGMPTWTPDSKAVIVFDHHAMHAFRIDIDDPTHRKPVAGEGWDGINIRNGAVYSVRADKPGIWEIDKGVRLITEKYQAQSDPALVFRGHDVLVPDYTAGNTPRILAQPLSGSPATLLAYAPGANGEVDFAINPRSGDIVYAANVTRDTNIDLLTLAKR